MKIDITNEILFKTARSGGKGGQNVNKVETMVDGRFDITKSLLLNDEQKKLIVEKLQNKITLDGFLFIKSQQARTQLANKEFVIIKMNDLINAALIKKKTRIATKTPKGVAQRRIDNKKRIGENKVTRKKINLQDI